MALTAKGLIVREYNVGEADRFVTVLTDNFGIIRASVRGARRVNSRSGASTRLLSYARFSLVKGREKYIIDTASPERVFFLADGDVERLALAQYFCELFAALAPREEPAESYLQLLLNALHLLEKGEHRDRIKAVTELRVLTLSGYMPDLHTCRCGKGAGSLYFDPLHGTLFCDACRMGDCVPLDATVYAAMRHIVCGEPSKAFSFRLPDDACIRLADVAERFVLAQLSRSFQTLNFYHSLDFTI